MLQRLATAAMRTGQLAGRYGRKHLNGLGLLQSELQVRLEGGCLLLQEAAPGGGGVDPATGGGRRRRRGPSRARRGRQRGRLGRLLPAGPARGGWAPRPSSRAARLRRRQKQHQPTRHSAHRLDPPRHAPVPTGSAQKPSRATPGDRAYTWEHTAAAAVAVLAAAGAAIAGEGPRGATTAAVAVLAAAIAGEGPNMFIAAAPDTP